MVYRLPSYTEIFSFKNVLIDQRESSHAAHCRMAREIIIMNFPCNDYTRMATLFFPARSFRVFATSPWRGGTAVCFFSLFPSSLFFFFSFDFSLFMCFLRFLSFLYFIECVCRAYRILYDDMTLHCPLTAVFTAYRYVAT